MSRLNSFILKKTNTYTYNLPKSNCDHIHGIFQSVISALILVRFYQNKLKQVVFFIMRGKNTNDTAPVVYMFNYIQHVSKT